MKGASNLGKKILIVDDTVFMRIKLKDILEKNGYEVAGEAQNGQEAFDKYQETKPDLVTMDITMPEVDGLESLKMIRKADANAKVIMCSAMGQQGMVMDAIRAGAIDFIVKPFDTERVIKALDKAFS